MEERSQETNLANRNEFKMVTSCIHNCFDWFSVCSYFNEVLVTITRVTPVKQPIKLSNKESSHDFNPVI